MLEQLVAFAAGASIFYRGIHVLRHMDWSSNHLHRLFWAIAVGGSVGLMATPLYGYTLSWIELPLIIAFGGLAAIDRRGVREMQHERSGRNEHV